MYTVYCFSSSHYFQLHHQKWYPKMCHEHARLGATALDIIIHIHNNNAL